MRFLYAIAIRIYILLHQLAAWVNPKAKQMVVGRKSIPLDALRIEFQHKNTWLFHCASLGEYEMALPIALKISEKYHASIVFSFYSPSGFSHAKLPAGDFTKSYLPWDKRKDIEGFLSVINPSAVVVIRYEFWLEFLTQINQRHIPLYLLGTSFRSDQFLWKFFGRSWKEAIAKAKYIGVIKSNMVAIAEQHGLSNAARFGDPKFSRAILRVEQFKSNHSTSNLPLAEKALLDWMNLQNTLVLGSSWPAEESMVVECLKDSQFKARISQKDWKILIAPHDISEAHIQNLLHQFEAFSPILYTEINTKFNALPPEKQPSLDQFGVVILNTVGQLPLAYSAAKIAIVGGAFGKGLHNITEALCFGLPVLFGPNFHKFPEAQDAIDAGVAFTFDSSQILLQALLQWINNPNLRNDITEKAIAFTQNNQADIVNFVKLTEKYNRN